MLQFEGDNLEIQINLLLKDDEKEYMLVTYDEIIFYANDSCKSEWAPTNEQPLRKKEQGLSIHVNDFLYEIIERLYLQVKQNNESNIPYKARKIIHPGKNRDGY